MKYSLELDDCTDPRMFDFSDKFTAAACLGFIYCSVSNKVYIHDGWEEKVMPELSVPDCTEPVCFSLEPTHSRE